MSTSLKSHPYQLEAHMPPLHADAATIRQYTKKASSKLDNRTSDVSSDAAQAKQSTVAPPSKHLFASAKSTSSLDKMASLPATGPPHAKGSHLGSELFDAIVQAADPRHPDHAAWQERYGSLSSRSSRASVSSGHKRDKLASPPQAGAPTSRKSFDHSDLATRRRLVARKPTNWELSYRRSSDVGGSDADDPLIPAVQSGEDRTTPVRASFEGSVRTYRSSSVTSSSHRRRARRLRDQSQPKPLVPPIPPPRVTSSTNWQSTYGSPSLPELASSTPHTAGHPSSSGNTSDNYDQSHLAVHAQRLQSSPSAPASLRMAHPYASAMAFEKEQDLRPLPSLPTILQPGFELHETPLPANRRHQAKKKLNTTSTDSPAKVFAATSRSGALLDGDGLQYVPQRPPVNRLGMPPPPANLSMRSASGSDQLAPSRKSMSKIRQLLCDETPALGRPPLLERPEAAQREMECASVSPHGSPPAVPPKNVGRNAHQPTWSASRTPIPELKTQEIEAIQHSTDSSRKIDLNLFPLRRDDEFRANEFEMSDDSEPDYDERGVTAGRPQLSLSTSPLKPRREPGVMRRSLDSIISPFRAGLLGSASPATRQVSAGLTSKSSLAVSKHEPFAQGRRSFSDSRFVRPFLGRPRDGALSKKTRPLSKVLDRPDDEVTEVLQPCNGGLKNGQATFSIFSPEALSPELQEKASSKLDDRAQHWTEAELGSIRTSTAQPQIRGGISPSATDTTATFNAASMRGTRRANLRGMVLPQTGPESVGASWDASVNTGWPDAFLPSMASSRSLASTFSRSTSNLHENRDSPFDAYARSAALSMQQRPRSKFGGLFTKVKGSITSPLASPPADTASPAPVKKSERSFRSRVKSLTTPRVRSKDDTTNVPAVPIIPRHLTGLESDEAGSQEQMSMAHNYSSQTLQMAASISNNFATPDLEPTRSVWEESPQALSSSTFPSAEKASRSIGRLLRRKKTQEDVDAVIDSFVPLPPKLSHPDAVDEAMPRSSMSSARGFDVVDPVDSSVNVAQTRTTIRKTLSPALLSDTPQPGIDATFEDGDLSSLGHVEGLPVAPRSDFNTGEGDTGLPQNMNEDAAEELNEAAGDEQRFRSPLGRFIRGNAKTDRLSRVEELSERLSYISDPAESNANRASSSMPTSPNPRSFAEHRSVRRSVSGNVLGQAVPPTLALAGSREARPGKVSLDILRPGKKQEAPLRDVTAADSPASLRSATLSSPATTNFASAPKSPTTPGFGEHLTPSWRSTSFSTMRTGRTSFSQDRDRSPVASPMSPSLQANRGVGHAIKRLGIKGKSKKLSKGIGPSDIIVLDFTDDELGDALTPEMSSRPSMSVEPRPSFGGGARPSFSSLAHPSIGGARPSIEATGRNSLVATEIVTKLLEVEANGLVPSPVAPLFGTNGLGQQLPNEMGRSVPIDGDGSMSGGEVAGLGIGSVQWSEGMPLQKTDSVEVSGSASDGTFTSQGIHTPENGSLSHSYLSQIPMKQDSTGVATPLVGASIDAGLGTPATGQMKSAELLAFEDMLGRFPQQQKVLLQDISARVAKTPIAGGGGSSSREDSASLSGMFPSDAQQ